MGQGSAEKGANFEYEIEEILLEVHPWSERCICLKLDYSGKVILFLKK